MAVHNFHIGIELVLRTILLKYDIRREKELNINFNALLKDADKALKDQDIKIPFQQQIKALNTMRGLIQHHAKVPDSSDIDDYRLYSEKFLASVFEDYFECDFDETNRVSFVKNGHLKTLLEISATRLSEDEYIKSACYSAAVFEYARYSISHEIKGMYNARRISSAMSRFRGNNRRDEYELKYAFERTLERVLESERLTILLTSGVLLSDYRKFNKLAPYVKFASMGNPHFFFTGSDFNVNHDVAEWLLQFVVNSIINWQQIGLNPMLGNEHIRGFDHFLEKGVERIS